jgi:hypothetical protein
VTSFFYLEAEFHLLMHALYRFIFAGAKLVRNEA